MCNDESLTGVIMILGGSMEFEKGHNPEVVERPTDNEEIPTVRQVFTNAQPRVHSDKMVRKF